MIPKELLAQVVLMIVIDIWLVEKLILSGDYPPPFCSPPEPNLAQRGGRLGRLRLRWPRRPFAFPVPRLGDEGTPILRRPSWRSCNGSCVTRWRVGRVQLRLATTNGPPRRLHV